MSPKDDEPYVSITLSWQAALVAALILSTLSGIGVLTVLHFLGVFH